jgi:hypothetical protein
VAYTIDAPGLSELAFTRKPRAFRFEGSAPAEAAWTEESGFAFLRFHAVGRLTLHCTF